MTDDLHATDFYSWTQQQAALLRSGRLDSVDVANIVEEIETLGRSERASLKSAYRLVCSHLLKMKYQPDKCTHNWYDTIDRERTEVAEILDENPGLRPSREGVFARAYLLARRDAARETQLLLKTFPERSPFTLAECESTSFVPSELHHYLTAAKAARGREGSTKPASSWTSTGSSGGTIKSSSLWTNPRTPDGLLRGPATDHDGVVPEDGRIAGRPMPSAGKGEPIRHRAYPIEAGMEAF